MTNFEIIREKHVRKSLFKQWKQDNENKKKYREQVNFVKN